MSVRIIIFENPSYRAWRYDATGDGFMGFRSNNFATPEEAEKHARSKFSVATIERGADPAVIVKARAK